MKPRAAARGDSQAQSTVMSVAAGCCFSDVDWLAPGGLAGCTGWYAAGGWRTVCTAGGGAGWAAAASAGAHTLQWQNHQLPAGYACRKQLSGQTSSNGCSCEACIGIRPLLLTLATVLRAARSSLAPSFLTVLSVESRI
jgi:hypothetical protein